MPHGTSRSRSRVEAVRSRSPRAWPATGTARGRRRGSCSSRARSKKRTPLRVNVRGSRRNARSWTVTTSGADRGGMAMPVAWTTSTGPVARSTAGRRSQVPRLVERLAGQREVAHRERRRPGGRAADRRGGRPRRPGRPRSVAGDGRDLVEGRAGGAAGHAVPALLEGDRDPHGGHPGTRPRVGDKLSRDAVGQHAQRVAGGTAHPAGVPGCATCGGYDDLPCPMSGPIARVLVTGGSGFLGRAVLARAWRQRGAVRLVTPASRRVRPARARTPSPACSPTSSPTS